MIILRLKLLDSAIYSISSKVAVPRTLVHMTGQGVIGGFPYGSDIPMPHKHNADRRHYIPKMVQGAELAGLRSGLAPARQSDVVD